MNLVQRLNQIAEQEWEKQSTAMQQKFFEVFGEQVEELECEFFAHLNTRGDREYKVKFNALKEQPSIAFDVDWYESEPYAFDADRSCQLYNNVYNEKGEMDKVRSIGTYIFGKSQTECFSALCLFLSDVGWI